VYYKLHKINMSLL